MVIVGSLARYNGCDVTLGRKSSTCGGVVMAFDSFPIRAHAVVFYSF